MDDGGDLSTLQASKMNLSKSSFTEKVGMTVHKAEQLKEKLFTEYLDPKNYKEPRHSQYIGYHEAGKTKHPRHDDIAKSELHKKLQNDTLTWEEVAQSNLTLGEIGLPITQLITSSCVGTQPTL